MLCTNKNIRSIAFTIATLAYLLVGASVFDALESANENAKRLEFAKFRDEVMRNYSLNMSAADELLDFLLEGKHFHSGPQWSFAGSFYFATTVITMIGYGHNTPHTENGKLFCMVYALTGIPLGMIMFQSIGERMNALLTWFMLRTKRLLGMSQPEHISQSTLIFISLNLCGVVFVVGAVVFKHYEQWLFLDCVYYCFITLTTIGFGDYVALQSGNALASKPDYVAFTLIFILFGLAVISSAMNLFILRFLRNTSEEDSNQPQEGKAALSMVSRCTCFSRPNESRNVLRCWQRSRCAVEDVDTTIVHGNHITQLDSLLYNPWWRADRNDCRLSKRNQPNGDVKLRPLSQLRRTKLVYSSPTRYTIVRAPAPSGVVSRLFGNHNGSSALTAANKLLSVSFAPELEKELAEKFAKNYSNDVLPISTARTELHA